MKRTESRRTRKEAPKLDGGTVAALAVFALLVIAGPLLFGARFEVQGIAAKR